MCSITTSDSAPVTVAGFGAAVDQLEVLVDVVAGALADPDRFDLGSVPAELAARFTTALLRVADRGTAAATVLAGHVAAEPGTGSGALIAGRYASPRRWLEVEAGLSASSATALLARARDLREHSGAVERAWLGGEVSGDAVRALTCRVTGALKTLSTTREEKARLRAEALEVLLPVARAGTVADLGRAVGRLRLLAESAYVDPDREAARLQAGFEAYDDQALTCVQVGDHSILTATLTHENAAAAMTAIDAYARRIAERDPDVAHEPGCPLADPAPIPAAAPGTDGSGGSAPSTTAWCTCGASAAAGVVSTANWPHLRAVAFGELMTSHLDNGQVGSHHGIAPHITVTVGLEHLHAALGGELTLPGTDEPVLLSTAAARRIMCDADITPIIVDRVAASVGADDETDETDERGASGPGRLARLLLDTAVAVLHVGRSQRTATLRQRRALEARDRHCVFPGCRAHPRRCQAHHVIEWENGGGTDLSNLALLCVRHHHAVHEGGWTITRTPGLHANQTGCWTLAPPRTQP